MRWRGVCRVLMYGRVSPAFAPHNFPLHPTVPSSILCVCSRSHKPGGAAASVIRTSTAMAGHRERVRHAQKHPPPLRILSCLCQRCASVSRCRGPSRRHGIVSMPGVRQVARAVRREMFIWMTHRRPIKQPQLRRHCIGRAHTIRLDQHFTIRRICPLQRHLMN